MWCMTTEPFRSVRDRLSEVVDRVEQQHEERVTITRNGRDAAVLVSRQDGSRAHLQPA